MRVFLVSFRKILSSLGFWLCVGMTILLMFSTQIYTDPNTQNRYSVIRALTNLTTEELAAHHEFCSIMVIQNARGGWFTLFAPIITAFCFVPTMCAEREENAVRFQIFRTSKLKYGISEFLSGMISGGTAVALGYIIFCGAAAVLFPGVSQMSGYEAEFLKDITFGFPKLVLGIWLFGAFWSVPAMFLTSVLRNKYLIMCIPFFAKYALSQTVQKLSQNAYADFENVDDAMLKFINTVNPDGLLWATYTANQAAALFFGITAAVFFAMFIIITQKRGDCGA